MTPTNVIPGPETRSAALPPGGQRDLRQPGRDRDQRDRSEGNVVEGNLIGPTASGGAGAGNTWVFTSTVHPATHRRCIRRGGKRHLGQQQHRRLYPGQPIGRQPVTGNIIGLGPDGSHPLPNQQNGIFIENAPGNVNRRHVHAASNVISANKIVGVYILGGQSVGNVVEGNLIGFAANGSTRVGNGQYGVLLYNAPANTVVRSGPNANRITGSGIANFREFTGRRVTANPTGGRKSQQPTSGRRVHRPSTAQRRVVVGQPTPAGPVRRKAHGMLARELTR